MKKLIIRNIDKSIVTALHARARRLGVSPETAHRSILEAALIEPERRTFADVLRSMPDVGQDEDFERV